MPSYAREGGAPGAGADPDVALLEAPLPSGAVRSSCFFFLGMASGERRHQQHHIKTCALRWVPPSLA